MDSPSETLKPKRRVRYKGTHPTKFSEKYKELNPERYAADVEKIKNRGTTPVGSHRPILVDEILDILKPQPGELALDATLGYGGHASAVLERILPGGRLIGVDQDPIERPKTEARLRAKGISESSLVIAPINFIGARSFLQKIGVPKVDMILADLGVSSMQLDDPSRGFSFKTDAPLDLRMNPSVGESAAVLLTRLNADTLATYLADYADETRALLIARALIKAKPKTTLQLTAVVQEVVAGYSSRLRKEEGESPVRRAFQALRIAVNAELSALEQLLKDIPHMLNPGGRVAILSFHSGEDRRVKKSFQALARTGVYRAVAKEFMRPSFEEQNANPRSRSAKLRWAVKG